MSVKFKYLMMIVVLLMVWRCTKPYLPAEVTTDYGYLVVEGSINPGTDSTIIKLSRTVKLSAKTTTRAELKAVVTVENEQNISYALKETTNGYYVFAGLNLDNSKKYRLRIKTTSGKIYASDFVAVKNPPVIDSIGYTTTDTSLTVYNNAHDNTNSTRYYRYEYQETWQFQAAYQSKYVTDAAPGGVAFALQPRTATNQIFTCWANDASTTIILSSTAKQTQDILNQNPITSIRATSEKLSIKYSILLKQYALTSDAYDYWALLKKNTEQLGSIFDAQPTALNGNIHNVADATEPVIGYLSIGIVQTKRVFISKINLPVIWVPFTGQTCTIDTAFFSNPMSGNNDVKSSLLPNPPSAIAVDIIPSFNPVTGYRTTGFSRTSIPCGDCTLKGVNKQPSFWK